MGAEIDRLEVQVEAQATKANNQLDKMVGKLDRIATSLMNINSGGLVGLANGISKFAHASSQLSNVKTADFTRLAKNIQGISSINTQQIYGMASAMTMMSKAISSLESVSAGSEQVTQIAASISKLGSKSVQKAIDNLPHLATALNDFMSVMSKAPTVSRNVIKMTESLAALASQGAKVGTAARSVDSALNSYGKSADRATRKTKSLASMIGTLNANFFWVKRGIEKIYKFTGSSMDFLETVNYFEVAMKNIGNSAAAQWRENGYASAEAYAESFSERAKQLTAKMTGYSIDKDGNATYTGMKNLGMDPDKVLQYQATFAQISASIGVAEESALNFSKALTMLGADWASLRNLTFDQGWEKFASALAGQSRAVRSLGIDITNATLQEYAYKYGLEQAVSEMNQATKAQLRLLAILDQSKVAYGDLANTIESPSNQIRMFQQNVSNLGRVIGNLFLPILQKTLPWINGMAIALQRMFTWIGNMLGIKFDSINSSMGGMSDEMYDLVDGADDLADGISEADKAAKKLNKTLQGWHEINNITTKDGGNGGAGGIAGGNPLLDGAIADALSDYEKVWNEAFERMENKTQMFAERIGKYFEPIKKIIQDLMAGDFYAAGQDTSALVSGIIDFFSRAIDDIDWEALGNNIGEYLAGVDWVKVAKSWITLKFEIAKAIWEVFKGSFEEAPFETSVISSILLLKFTPLGGIASTILAKAIGKKFGQNATFASVGATAVKSIAKSITGAISNVGGLGNLLTLDMAALVGETGWATAGLLAGGAIIGGLTAGVGGFTFSSWLTKILMGDEAPEMTGREIAAELWSGIKEGDIWSALGEWWTDVWDGIKLVSKDTYDAIDKWGYDTADSVKASLEKTGESFVETKNEWAKATADWWVNDVEPWFTKEKWGALGENMKGGIEGKWNNLVTWWKNTGFYKWWQDVSEKFSVKNWTFKGIEDGLSQAWSNAIEAVKGIWNKFATWLNEKLDFSWDSVSIMGKEVIPAGKINLGKIPTFSTGGYPEDGLFMANHGELVGQFANGKTAVANNDQITAGIEEAAYRGISRALSESGGNNVTFQIEGDPYGMFKVMQKESRDYKKRNGGKPAFG